MSNHYKTRTANANGHLPNERCPPHDTHSNTHIALVQMHRRSVGNRLHVLGKRPVEANAAMGEVLAKLIGGTQDAVEEVAAVILVQYRAFDQSGNTGR